MKNLEQTSLNFAKQRHSIGDIIYHNNIIGRCRIKKISENLSVVEHIDDNMMRNIKGELVYKVSIITNKNETQEI